MGQVSCKEDSGTHLTDKPLLLLQAPRDKYVLGGVHMTDPANLITFMLKVLCWDDSVVSNE